MLAMVENVQSVSNFYLTEHGVVVASSDSRTETRNGMDIGIDDHVDFKIYVPLAKHLPTCTTAPSFSPLQ